MRPVNAAIVRDASPFSSPAGFAKRERMGHLAAAFVTRIYRHELGAARGLLADLERACRSIAIEDRAGQGWAAENNYPGYTSYASLTDLPERDPAFADLAQVLDDHVATFAKACDMDLGGRRLSLDSLWVNILEPGGFHAAHIHPHSAVSGTVYVTVPKGASAIRFEDPRLAMMMSSPPRKARAREDNRTFLSFDPKPGTLLLWESYLRHDVPVNRARTERISVSFNYAWH
jgi:uncharacterized protein (TIGR02466 family)